MVSCGTGVNLDNLTRFFSQKKYVFLVSVPTKNLDLVESSEGIPLILDNIVSNNAYLRVITVSEKSTMKILYFLKEIRQLTLNGFSPVCVLSCLINCDGFWNFLLQVLQVFLKNFVLTESVVFRFFFCFNFNIDFNLL